MKAAPHLVGITVAMGMLFTGYLIGSEFAIVPPLGKPEPLALQIAEELRLHPQRWSGNDITITNGEVCVWIGNSTYALGVRPGKWCLPNEGHLSRASKYLILTAAYEKVVPRLRSEKLVAIETAIKQKHR